MEFVVTEIIRPEREDDLRISRVTARSTIEVLEDHLARRSQGEVEGDLERNYASDVIWKRSRIVAKVELVRHLSVAESHVHRPCEAAAEYASFPGAGSAIKTINRTSEIRSDVEIVVRADIQTWMDLHDAEEGRTPRK